MKQLKKILILFSALLTMAASFYCLQGRNEEHAIESITYFPLDTDAHFLDAKTRIMDVQADQNKYKITIRTYSRLDRLAYLRQDITFVFANGVLIGKFGQWKEETDKLEMKDTLSGKNNQIIRAISFHHAELHYPEDDITSSQQMSQDFLYIIPSSLPPVTFQTPNGEAEIGWKEVLDREEHNVISSVLKEAVKEMEIDLSHFHIIPLNELENYQKQPFPSFTREQTDQIIGQLWEGLYKNYFLGIRTPDGIISPIGSTIPVILLNKNKQNLYVITLTSENELISLKQKITTGDLENDNHNKDR
jgi:hypothetical protein